MPAINAPKARLKPASSVSQARPSVMSRRFKIKSSSLLRRATKVSHQRMMRCPPVSKRAIKNVALSAANASAVANFSGDEPSAGISTSSGTTAKSWNSSTPITRLPCSLSISSRSTISLTTMAVLLMDSAPPKANALCHDICQYCCATMLRKIEAPVAKTIVNST